MNQDCLEQLFSILRAKGGQNHTFGALDFMRRLRNHILGAGGDYSIEAANIKPCEKDNFHIQDYIDPDLEIEAILVGETELEQKYPDDQTETEIVDDIDDILNLFNDSCIKNDLKSKAPDDEIQLDLPQEMEIDSIAENFKDTFSYAKLVDQTMQHTEIDKETLVKDLKICEQEFQRFHSNSDDGLLRTHGVIDNLVSKLQTIFKGRYEDKMLRAFVLKRTNSRMTHIYQTTIKHKKSQRHSYKIAQFVHSKPSTSKAGKTTAEKLENPAKRPKK